MRSNLPTPPSRRGSSLIEVVIAMGVLAVAVPLVLGAIAESGRSSSAAEADTRSSWIIPTCMAEVRASRAGSSSYFPTTAAGQVFPNSGEVWALGFTPEGKVVDKITTKTAYDKGVKSLGTQTVGYIASFSSTKLTTTVGPAMVRVKITLEFPAAAPSNKRQKLDFYSRIQ